MAHEKTKNQTASFIAAPSGDDLRYQFSVDVRESHLAAVIEVCQPLMVESEQRQDCGMKIENGNRLLRDLVPELVALADHLAAFDSGSGHPHGEGVGIVIASNATLGDRHAPE